MPNETRPAHTLSPEDHAALLARCWMSHDAKWFAVVAAALGIEVANRLGRAAAQAQGRAEAEEIMRALGLPAVAGLDDYLGVQDTLLQLLAPGLFDVVVEPVDDRTCHVRIKRCVVHERVTHAGIAAQYECGVFARLAGWLQALGLRYSMHPSFEGCPKACGRECAYTIVLQRAAADLAGDARCA